MNQQQINIESIGRVASGLQVHPSQIVEIASKLSIEPALILNGILHFEISDSQRIAEYLRLSHRPPITNRPIF